MVVSEGGDTECKKKQPLTSNKFKGGISKKYHQFWLTAYNFDLDTSQVTGPVNRE